jgi:class 3 adenylate cyclase/TolB-like protein
MSARDHRRLAAILAADVVGFSRMMEADEAGTLACLRSARADVFEAAVSERGGRIVKTTGDGFLVEFGSAVDAVRCAIGIQEAMAAQDTGLAFRIGVNLGDVVVDGDDIFGDGVNIAARLEALAPPGGVSIAGNVAEQITGKIAARFVNLGEKQVKNISRPINVWQWSPQSGRDRGATAGLPARSSDRGRNPVVVVLPFAAPVGDADVTALSEGLADDLTVALSRRRGIEVLARSTTAALKMPARDLPEVRAASGADYVLTGSLRRSGTRLRVNAELVETVSGAQLWSNRYDEEWGDLFGLEDALTDRIATAIRPAMNANVGRRHGDRPESALTNAERRAKAAQHFFSFTPAGFAAAERLLDATLADAPDDAMALSMQAFCLMMQGFFGSCRVNEETAQRALAMAARAVELDRNSDYAYETRGLLALHLRGDCRAALADARRALALNPQYALAIQLEGEALIYAGAPEEGIQRVGKAIASDLRDPTNFYRHSILAVGRFLLCDYAGALEESDQAAQGAFDMPLLDLVRAAILVRLGRQEAAGRVMAHVLARSPDITAATIRLPPFQRAEDRERYLDALRRAGMPEA